MTLHWKKNQLGTVRLPNVACSFHPFGQGTKNQATKISCHCTPGKNKQGWGLILPVRRHCLNRPCHNPLGLHYQ